VRPTKTVNGTNTDVLVIPDEYVPGDGVDNRRYPVEENKIGAARLNAEPNRKRNAPART